MSSDTEAADAIREAMKDLADSNQPSNRHTVPDEATKKLKGDDALERVYREVEGMVKRGELDAPMEPWKDWKLLDG